MEDNYDKTAKSSESWFSYFANKLQSVVSYFKRSNPISISLQPEDLSSEPLPFTDYSYFQELTGLKNLFIYSNPFKNRLTSYLILKMQHNLK